MDWVRQISRCVHASVATSDGKVSCKLIAKRVLWKPGSSLQGRHRKRLASRVGIAAPVVGGRFPACLWMYAEVTDASFLQGDLLPENNLTMFSKSPGICAMTRTERERRNAILCLGNCKLFCKLLVKIPLKQDIGSAVGIQNVFNPFCSLSAFFR